MPLLSHANVAKGPRHTRDLPVKGDTAIIAKLEAENVRKWKRL